MKKFIVSLSLLLAVSPVLAAPRTAQQAQDIARQFVGSLRTFAGVRSTDLKLASNAAVGPRVVKGAAAVTAQPYYIYNVKDKGFVVVSGDDRFADILGYSLNGSISDDTAIPDGLQYWLSCLAEEMNAADATALKAPRPAADADVTQSVEPLLKTKWNQNAPYNDKLQGYMTGCVATGVAQVMKFWEYPVTGTGEHKGAYAPYFSADFSSVRYDWKNMLNEYGTGWESRQEVDAVSTLMLHLGVATDMRWGKDQSGTPNNFAAYALHNYFGYNKNLYVESRDHVSAGAWKALLIQQLQSGHPLCYSGMSSKTGSSAGHFFVCDGYDALKGLFHFNWGWSGRYDGYYAVTALEPGTGGIGAGAGQFNYYQSIFVNVQPETCGEYQAHFDAVTVKPSGTVKSRIKVSTTGLTNNNTYNFAGTLGIAVYNADGSFNKYLPSPVTLPLAGFNIGSSYTTEYSYEVDASDLANGTYTISAAVWSDRDQKTFPVRANYTNPTYYTMTVSGSNVTFGAVSTEPSLSLTSMELVNTLLSGTIFQNYKAHFRLVITNNSAIAFNDEVGVQFEQSRSKKGVISTPVTIAAGETKTVDVYGIIPQNVNPGTATAKAVYGYDGTFSTLGNTLTVSVMTKDDAVPVQNIQADNHPASPAYNLSGQRASQNAKGIIITNGKKHLR